MWHKVGIILVSSTNTTVLAPSFTERGHQSYGLILENNLRSFLQKLGELLP